MFEDAGQDRDRADGQDARQAGQGDGERRGRAGQVNIRVRDAANRARGHQQQAGLDGRVRPDPPDQGERDGGQHDQRREQAHGHDPRSPANARKIGRREFEADREQCRERERRRADVQDALGDQALGG
ncbi:MAG: hypothetical protein MZV64_05015 [Ignavibacteriales bacterium]|nr:hypothetical protein [Ignavibacteriales bacterium]